MKQSLRCVIIYLELLKLEERFVTLGPMLRLSLRYISLLFFIVGCGSSRENTRTADSHLQLGSSMIQKGQYEQGLKQLLVGRKLDSSNPKIHNQLGVTYYLMKEYEHSILSFKDALSSKERYSAVSYTHLTLPTKA